ncbi:MAG TPA: DUF4124 domain-containing protein [Burkholderiales bacterium]|nr:DUF4124 domain-containing protein [Burkholderiales bacterium]
MTRLPAIFLALALSGAATAQTYKWTDQNGRVQYGDVPPGDATNVTRLKGGTAGSPPAAAPDAKKDAKPLTPEQAFQKRQQERDQADQKAAQERNQAEQKRVNCEQARASVRQMESGQRVATVNAAGERVFLEDDQRAAQLARAQKAVADWCN